jgi:very-short-patch-repair endonuclease
MKRTDRELLDHARVLRAELTQTETLVWRALRGRRFMGLKWRRQVPWNGFVLDFFCPELQMVIELDGAQHAEEKTAAYDALRLKQLQDAGIKVVRLWNTEVLFALKNLFEIIRVETVRRRTAA